jgi:hypothetical protein
LALALAGGTIATTALPSGAAEQELNLKLAAGSIRIVETSLPLPADPDDPATFYTGTWDDETGEVNGTLTVPAITLEIDNPLVPGTTLPIVITITQLGDSTGNIDPATGDGNVEVTVEARISSPDPAIGPAIGPNCVLSPIAMNLTADADLGADPVLVGLTQDGFIVPGAQGCGEGGVLNPIINDTLGIGGDGTNDTSASLRFFSTDEAPPEPTTTTTSTTAPGETTTTTAAAGRPGATAATPVAARPAYTG